MNKTLFAAVLLSLVFRASADTTYTWVPDGNDGVSSGTATVDGSMNITSFAFSWTPNGPKTPVDDTSITSVSDVALVSGDLVFTGNSQPSDGDWAEDGASSNEKFKNGNETLNGHWALSDSDPGDPNPPGDPPGGNSAPDSGTTVCLLGTAFSGLGFFSRFIKGRK
jgi:hypothetical protein